MLAGVFRAVVSVEFLPHFNGLIRFGGYGVEFDVPAAPFAIPAHPGWRSNKHKETFILPLHCNAPPYEDRVPTGGRLVLLD